MSNRKAFFLGVFFFLLIGTLVAAVDKSVYDQAKFQAFISKITGTLNFDSNTFVVDANNNRVGVGNSIPGEKLDVSGAIKSRADGSGYNYHIFDTTGVTLRGSIYSSPSSVNYVGWSGVGLSFTSNNSANGLTLSSDGTTASFSGMRLGVGDSAPGQALTIKSAADSLQAVGVYDSRPQAAGVGASMAIGGRHTDGSTGLTTFGQISATKENSTSGNYAGNLVISTNNGSSLSERMKISSDGKVSVTTTYGVIRQGSGSSGHNAGTYKTEIASGSTSCDTQCAADDSNAGFNGSSGRCLGAWYFDGTWQGCSGTGTSDGKTCLCMGTY